MRTWVQFWPKSLVMKRPKKPPAGWRRRRRASPVDGVFRGVAGGGGFGQDDAPLGAVGRRARGRVDVRVGVQVEISGLPTVPAIRFQIWPWLGLK